MQIAILGAGFTGLASAYRLAERGHNVVVFEKEAEPGGLAIGYKEKEWNWSLERHYHHWFANDASVLGMAKEIGYEVFTARPKTSVYVDNASYQLDSPVSLLTFKKLSLMERLRMGSMLALLRYDPFWQPLEHIRASTFLKMAMGKRGYEMIWEPQLLNKFGPYADEISLAWFWARIRKRTAALAYPKGGFLKFAKTLTHKIEEKGGEVHFDTEVIELKSKGKVVVKAKSQKQKARSDLFDKVIVTLPSFLFLKIAPDLPATYKERLMKLNGLGAINLVLRLRKPFLQDYTYWLSICQKGAPIMAIVEHTNFMDKKYYNNEHIVYLGNYLSHTHPYFTLTEAELLKTYHPFLKKINPSYQRTIIAAKMFSVPFAQPIIPLMYSRMMPSFETPLTNVYLANIQQVYPWDRGTNYAVELGEKVVRLACA